MVDIYGSIEKLSRCGQEMGIGVHIKREEVD